MKQILILALATVLSSEVYAQFSSSSPYSVYGPGLLGRPYTSLNRSIGYVGVGVQDAINLNGINPAANVWIEGPFSHVYEFGMFTEDNSYQTNQFKEGNFNGGLSNLNYWFRVKKWWTTTLSVTPFSTVSYNITSSKTLSASAETDYVYAGDGHITQLSMGNSFRLFNNFSAGLNLAYVFGSVNKSESVSATAFTESLTLNNKLYTNRFKTDFGIQYRINLPSNRSVVLGATYENSLKLKSKSDLTLTNKTDTLSTFDGESTTFTLPSRIATGASLQMKRSRIAADIVFEPWSRASYPGITSQFMDSWRYGVGYSFLGNPESENYWGAIRLNAGAYYQNYPVKIENQVLPNYGFTLGIGLPVLDGKSTINLTYGYDRFGTVNESLILQRTQRIMLDIVIRDIWGYRRKFD
jgi:hypothetical protein